MWYITKPAWLGQMKTRTQAFVQNATTVSKRVQRASARTAPGKAQALLSAEQGTIVTNAKAKLARTNGMTCYTRQQSQTSVPFAARRGDVERTKFPEEPTPKGGELEMKKA